MLSRDNSPLRVAAYCRVSTDKDDQLNSLTAQQRFFQSHISEHPDWTLAGIFADEGLSGTSTKHRPQFSEMIRRAMDGEIDLIVTKEVSRFARNTVDTLQVTRQLKEKGVGVFFLNDNIDTRDNDGEFRLTIMASVAQEESRKISERTRWGQLQAMKNGVVFGNNSLYGYMVRNGRLTVQPEQAEIVRQVYHKFLVEGKGTHTIARELTENGVRPPLRPSGAWTSSMVLKILKNGPVKIGLNQKHPTARGALV
ncbi:MAG: recombinase family protein [Oscillibacter sp.]|nr:recombinase family protein [Oscillibacter sp.]